MVMELIEGETLAARIDKGALPLDQALKFAIQIADALDRAHRAGVTHRDVKPQNIMLARDGVKVLDFGLAKSGSKPGPTEETLTRALTTEGAVMGTPQYMAPEQFDGREADARSDIWAFGAVLYEMVTGQKAFQGKSYSSLLGAILTADPAPMAVKPITPLWLERLVRRCLAKDPEDRWQSMRDVVIELKTPPLESTASGVPKVTLWPWIAMALAAIVAASAMVAFLYTRRMLAGSHQPVTRFLMGLLPAESILGPPETNYLALPTRTAIAWSPDGQALVFGGGLAGAEQLYVRRLDQLQATPLAGTEGAASPFLSLDGQWVRLLVVRQTEKSPTGRWIGRHNL
jgi:serine/threonine-protein kinase